MTDECKTLAQRDQPTAISHIEDTPTIDRILKRRAVIQEAMSKAMKSGVDYGTIPGCGTKPTLLQPGAEKIANLFKLAPDPEMEIIDLPNGHREYRFKCRLLATDGTFLGAGVGSCSTMETKYRYRSAGRVCPECGGDFIIKGKAEYGGGWLCFKKKGGCGATFPDDDSAITDQETGKVENPDIADVYNTVEKMAYKRAFVSAVLKVTAASDVFTQDIEDMPQRRPSASQASTPEPGYSQAPQWENAPPAPSGKASGGPKNIDHPTDKQIKLIWVKAKILGYDEDSFKAYLQKWFKTDEPLSPADLTYEEGKAVIDYLVKKEAAKDAKDAGEA